MTNVLDLRLAAENELVDLLASLESRQCGPDLLLSLLQAAFKRDLSALSDLCSTLLPPEDQAPFQERITALLQDTAPKDPAPTSSPTPTPAPKKDT
jgi:hypothetical protein